MTTLQTSTKESLFDRIAKWIRKVDNIEGAVALGLGVLMLLQPLANSFQNSFVSITMGFLFIWVGFYLLFWNGGHQIFFTSVMLRTLHLSALLVETANNLDSGYAIFVIISLSSIIYAFIKKLDEIDNASRH